MSSIDGTLPTVLVTLKETGLEMRINQVDFDERLHKLVEKPKEDKEGKEAKETKETEVEPEDPKEDPKSGKKQGTTRRERMD